MGLDDEILHERKDNRQLKNGLGTEPREHIEKRLAIKHNE